MADTLILLGQADVAMKLFSARTAVFMICNILQSILQRDQSHTSALLGYSKVLFKRATEATDVQRANELHQEALQVLI